MKIVRAVIGASSPIQIPQGLAIGAGSASVRWLPMKPTTLLDAIGPTFAGTARPRPPVHLTLVRTRSSPRDGGLLKARHLVSERGRSVRPPALSAEEQQRVVSASVAVGGLLRAEAFCHLLLGKEAHAIPRFARWMVDGQLLCVPWCGDMMVPLFQFERPVLEPMRVIREVRDELLGVFDDWEILDWFVSANTALEHELPARRVASDPDSVLQAARMDRFIAAGL